MTRTATNCLQLALWRVLPAMAVILMVFAASQVAFPAMAQADLINSAGTRTGQVFSSDSDCRTPQPGPPPTLSAACNQEISGPNTCSPVDWRSRGGTAFDMTTRYSPGPT
jgi:hypothetical protein